MEHFAAMIFEQWQKENDYNMDYFTNKGSEILEETEKILHPSFVDKFYDLLCENGEEIMREAFIAGFGYACKCLSNGKIELGGGKNA